MTIIKRFEDILAYQKAEILTVDIYKSFGKSRDFGFRDQICRAAVSMMNNIAEGFERHTNKEFINFLYIAKGSAGEVRSMLSLANKLNYLDEIEYKKLTDKSVEVSRLIMSFIKTIR
jgi:four helix bundle protein